MAPSVSRIGIDKSNPWRLVRLLISSTSDKVQNAASLCHLSKETVSHVLRKIYVSGSWSAVHTEIVRRASRMFESLQASVSGPSIEKIL